MAGSHTTFVGVDVQAAPKPYFYTVLDSELEIIACCPGRLTDVLAYLSGLSSAVVAINGPVGVEIPETKTIQEGLFGETENPSCGVRQRTGDRELLARGFPHAILPRKAPPWVERSLELAEGIRQLKYKPIDSDDAPRVFFETQADAAYWHATGSIPYDVRSLEGRLQRQLLLCEFGFDLKDPMEFLEEFTRHRLRTSRIPVEQVLPAHELRALLAASTAWLIETHPDSVDHFGVRFSGEIILPREFVRRQST